jgi:hypothetical protein
MSRRSRRIDGGALRTPDAQHLAPVSTTRRAVPRSRSSTPAALRLDGTGPVQVAANTTLVLSHTVQDFET